MGPYLQGGRISTFMYLFELPMRFQCWEIMKIATKIFMFPKINSAWQRLRKMHSRIFFVNCQHIVLTATCWSERRISTEVSQITSNLTACPTARIIQADNNSIIKGPHYWPFVRGIHQSLVDSLHKGPVMLKCFHAVTSPCTNCHLPSIL